MPIKFLENQLRHIERGLVVDHDTEQRVVPPIENRRISLLLGYRLRGIRDLLQNAGYTIKGVQKILREQGIEQVKLAGAAAVQRGPSAVPADGVAKPLLLSPLQVRTLQKIAGELDACAEILKSGAVRRASPSREKRAASKPTP